MTEETGEPIIEPQEICFVTEDKHTIEGGVLDLADKLILRDASQNGRYTVRIINTKTMLETMAKTEPEKFEKFSREVNSESGRALTFEELVKLAGQGNSLIAEFEQQFDAMTLEQAAEIRKWRVEDRMTWRKIARTCSEQRWQKLGEWRPRSNQLAGMALCRKAALLYDEDYRDPPWN